jgi:quercetin dioxygenase-like cupin family protein
MIPLEEKVVLITRQMQGMPIVEVKHVRDVDAQAVENGIKTTIQVLISSHEGPNFAMRRFLIKRGGVMPKHTNTVEHEQFVLRGRACISINMDVYNVKSGDVIFIPEGAPHWYVNNGDEDFEFLCIVPNKKDVIRLVDDNSC